MRDEQTPNTHTIQRDRAPTLGLNHGSGATTVERETVRPDDLLDDVIISLDKIPLQARFLASALERFAGDTLGELDALGGAYTADAISDQLKAIQDRLVEIQGAYKEGRRFEEVA